MGAVSYFFDSESMAVTHPHRDTPTMSARIHGGADALGAARFDFSTNSNACGSCPEVRAAVQQADASAYPDPGYHALRQQLAAFHDVSAERILMAASASEFIFRVTSLAARRGGAVSLPPHSYGDYAHAALAHQLEWATTPAQAQLQWACEPSSPLGQAHAGLASQVDALAPNAMLVLDRAYEPLRLSGDAGLSRDQLSRVWQLWTPNKALSLTGVRAAYAIAPMHSDEEVAVLQALCPSWPVGSHGVALLQAWTGASVQAWLSQSLETLRLWKARQIAQCTALGWACLPSDGNFFCARPQLPAALSLPQMLTGLRAHGIQLRDAASFGLPGHVRVSVQPPLAQDALHNAWQQLIKDMQ